MMRLDLLTEEQRAELEVWLRGELAKSASSGPLVEPFPWPKRLSPGSRSAREYIRLRDVARQWRRAGLMPSIPWSYEIKALERRIR